MFAFTLFNATTSATVYLYLTGNFQVGRTKWHV